MKVLLLLSGFIFSAWSQSDIFVEHANSLLESYNINAANQSFCFRQQGQVLGSNIDRPQNPASVTKIYTSYFAIKIKGHNSRYETQFATDQENLYILGSNDPYFVTPNLVHTIKELDRLGYRSFKKIIFNKKFLFNWQDQPENIKKELERLLIRKQWSDEEFNAFNELPYTEKLADRIEFSNRINRADLDELYIFQSQKLIEQLKIINQYSNNFFHDHLFKQLGGEKKYNHFFFNELQTNKNSFYFLTGSGLGTNKTTCRLTLAIIEKLKNYLETENIHLAEVLPIPQIEPGTLRNRLPLIPIRSALAKTGSLRHTSTLAGKLYTLAGEIPYAILNHTTDLNSARSYQDDLITYMIDQLIADPFEEIFKSLADNSEALKFF